MDASAGSFEIVWGAPAIALAINRTERATYHMLESGRLPGAKKIAGRWCFLPSVFLTACATAEVPAHDRSDVAA